jgi:hypothetical protein
MSWHTITIERSALYREVWEQPMTTLAKRYGISDVGLRKICKKLNVPVPVAGHWAKVQHGKPSLQPPLPAEAPHFEHRIQRRSEPGEEHLASRLAALPTTVVPPVVYEAPGRLDECHRCVRNTETALEKGHRDEKGRSVAVGKGLVDVRVGPSTAGRALLLCESVIRACLAADLRLEERLGSAEGPRVRAGDYWYTWRISEVGYQTATAEVDSVAVVPATGRARRGMSSGSLRIDFVSDTGRAVSLTFRDRVDQRLEAQVPVIPNELLKTSAAAKVKADLAEEERLAREARWRERERLIALRKEELERLKATEALVEQWRRADALRQYCKAIEHSGFENGALDASALVNRIAWIRRAADWLDPSTDSHWPEIDDAPKTLWADLP